MRELLFLIALVLVPITTLSFTGCGNDDEKTDTAVESDAGETEEASADAGAESESDTGHRFESCPRCHIILRYFG